jgi:peptide/nickel transport system substrate-binding protein
VYQASAKMQEIWIRESPMIICYEVINYYAHRNDRYERIVSDVKDGIASWWTPYNVFLNSEHRGPFGTTLRMSHAGHAKFNPFVSCSCYGSFVDDIPWETLLRRSPTGEIIPWLAESYLIESSEDNSDVPDGHTRISFEIVQNATWSDTRPLTADDVAFSLNFYRDTRGIALGYALDQMTACYSPSPSTVVVEFQSVSYWHVSKFTSLFIVPKHVFGVPSFNVTRWNPDPTIGPIVSAGPFNYTDFVSGEYLELTFNPNYFYGMYRGMSPCLQTNNTDDFYPIELTGVSITVGSLVVLVGVIVIWKKEG